MQKSIELAKRIRNSPGDNWLLHLEDINLHQQFLPIYKLGYSQTQSNTIVALIIFSYDADSNWLDVRKDRYENKIDILKGLGVSVTDTTFHAVYEPILVYENDEVQGVITDYLLSQTDYRWQQIHSLLDYSTKMILFCNQRTQEKQKTETRLVKDGNGATEDVFEYSSVDEITKVNKSKGELLMKAIEARDKANDLLEQLKKDYVRVDTATQSDFNFTFTDVEKFDPLKWRDYIRKRNKSKV